MWNWTISRWRSRKSKWGVELLRRPRLRHSQIRVHLGRRRFTLMAVYSGGFNAAQQARVDARAEELEDQLSPPAPPRKERGA